MSKYNQGVILIEMLISLVVLSAVMFMILSLLTLAVGTIKYEHFATKSLQISSLITNDLSSSKSVEYTTDCIYITKAQEQTSYCFENSNLVRQVNGLGYEQIATDVNGEFKGDEVITMKLVGEETVIEIPIWSNYK